MNMLVFINVVNFLPRTIQFIINQIKLHTPDVFKQSDTNIPRRAYLLRRPVMSMPVRRLKFETKACVAQYHRIRRYWYSRSVTQANICPRFYKRFVINHAILGLLASTTGTLYLPKPDKNFRLY